jgi:AcrR family transcriptional regulator
MKLKMTRKYDMSVRTQAAEMTSEEIIKVVGELWMKYSIKEITLQMVAQNAGVTVMTILRKYGSKEGLFEATIRADTAGIQDVRKESQAGNISQAISILMKEYEYAGPAVIRTLAVENDLPVAAKILKKGRELHKEWCQRIFAQYLPASNDKEYQIMLGAFYAATDVYKWKLLRNDLGYSQKETEKIFIKTVRGIIKIKNERI